MSLFLIPSLVLCAATTTAMAAPMSLQKRAIMKGDDYIPLGNTTVPLTPLLLIFAALAVAVVGLLLILFRLFVPSCMSRSSRIILKEREQAKQDLRLCGGTSPRHSPNASPSLHTQKRMSNKPLRRVGQNSLASVPSEIMSLNEKRPAHGYRGTSFSLADARKYSDKSHRSSLSALGLPLLGSNDSSSGSSSLHLAPAVSERARVPISARNDLSRVYSNRSTHLYRNTSVGKGADLQRTRSGPREIRIPLKPQSVDPAYSQHAVRSDAFAHPLHQARRDSTLSIYEVTSSAEHSNTHDSASGSASPSLTNSRMGSFSMATANPLQPLLASTSHSSSSAWASPPPPLQPTRSYSPSIPVGTHPFDDSDESNSHSECVSPRINSAGYPAATTSLLVPSRLSSYTENH